MVLCFGDVVVLVDDRGTLITWSDGTSVPGEPEDTDSYRKTAIELGYGDDTLAMCQEHELLHVALCYWLGVPSPVMEALRRRPAEMAGAETRELEEAAILAVQKFAKATGVDIVYQMSRNYGL
jgi:hypothetical protein